MWNAKVLLGVALFMASIGLTLLTVTGPTAANQAAKGKVEVKVESHWAFHDGHWSFYHAADKLWYHTNGQHWFYHNGTGWAVYHLDKGFGREHFVKGAYVVPAKGAKIVIPTHAHYR